MERAGTAPTGGAATGQEPLGGQWELGQDLLGSNIPLEERQWGSWFLRFSALGGISHELQGWVRIPR